MAGDASPVVLVLRLPLQQTRPRDGLHLVEERCQIRLMRGCRRHGRVVTLHDESPVILRYLREWTAPTKAHIPDAPGNS